MLYTFATTLKLTTSMCTKDYLTTHSNVIYDLCGLDGFSFNIDGTHFPIRKVPKGVHKSHFFNRKVWKSISGQVVIDSRLRVVDFDLGYTGCTNDVTV